VKEKKVDDPGGTTYYVNLMSGESLVSGKEQHLFTGSARAVARALSQTNRPQ